MRILWEILEYAISFAIQQFYVIEEEDLAIALHEEEEEDLDWEDG